MISVLLVALLCVEPTPIPVCYDGSGARSDCCPPTCVEGSTTVVEIVPMPVPCPCGWYESQEEANTIAAEVAKRIEVLEKAHLPTPTPTPMPAPSGIIIEGRIDDQTEFEFFMAGSTDIRKVIEEHCGGCDLIWLHEVVVWCVEAESHYLSDGRKTRPWFACYDGEGHEVFRSVWGDGWIPVRGMP